MGAFISCSYTLFYEWSLGPLRFIITYEMEGVFGNIILNILYAVLHAVKESFFEKYEELIS